MGPTGFSYSRIAPIRRFALEMTPILLAGADSFTFRTHHHSQLHRIGFVLYISSAHVLISNR